MHSWNQFIKLEKQKDYFKKLVIRIQEDNRQYQILPKSNDVFNAFKFCPLDRVKIFILGQDPYIGDNQAHGLAFSVPEGTEAPPSLKNIFKEIKSDLSLSDDFQSNCLIPWAKQGVLLLNCTLTVRKGQSLSHADFGWSEFSDNVIKVINEIDRPVAHMLWGSFAQAKKKLLDNPKHLSLFAPHPSPLSAYRGFFGSKHFSQANKFLEDNNIEPINWLLK